MELSNWMWLELDREDRKRAEDLIAPLSMIKLIGMILGIVCVMLGIVLCIVYSVRIEAFLWYYLLSGVCGGVIGVFIFLIAQVQIHKMYLQIRLMRALQNVAARDRAEKE